MPVAYTAARAFVNLSRVSSAIALIEQQRSEFVGVLSYFTWYQPSGFFWTLDPGNDPIANFSTTRYRQSRKAASV
jgi:hypothetical protein